MLFDIGIAGPLAGFVVAVPALFIGLAHVARRPAAARLRRARRSASRCSSSSRRGCSGARTPDGYSLNLHPMAFAAWFGMLATALNLFPIGQLDGGHISYAVLGPRSTHVTLAMVGVRRRADLLLDELARLDRADDRDAVHVRPAPPADVRRGRPARPHAPHRSRSFALRHVHPLLHARADRADGADRTMRLQIAEFRCADSHPESI